MKKNYTLITMALGLILALPGMIHAQENNTPSDEGQKPPMMGKPDYRPGSLLPVMIRAKLGGENGNIGRNEDIRNKTLNNHEGTDSDTRVFSGMKNASGTPQMNRQRSEDHTFIGDDRHTMGSSTDEDSHEERRSDHPRFGRDEDMGSTTQGIGRNSRDMKNGSSTENQREMHKEEFGARKEMLSKQLELALQNLKQIRERINSRIDKSVQAGDNMTEAQSLLVTADAKIVVAENALIRFSAYTPVASTTASTTVDMTTARSLAETAIQSNKDAHQALVNVVRAIAHALGLELGEQNKNASSTDNSQETHTQ